MVRVTTADARLEISGSFRVSIIAFAGKRVTPVPPICLSLSLSISLSLSLSLSRAIRSSLHYGRQLVWFYPTSLLHVASDTRLLYHDVYLSSLRIAYDIRDNLSSFVECETRTRFADARRDVREILLLIRDYVDELSLA